MFNKMTQNPSGFRSALEIAGVDNWEWYGEALNGLSDNASDEEFIDALVNAGVDNWSCINYAIDTYKELYGSEDDSSNQNDDADETPENVEEDVVEVLSPANQRLLSIVGKEEFEKVRSTFWKRSSHPKEFDKASKIIKNGGSFEDAQMVLLDLVFKF